MTMSARPSTMYGAPAAASTIRRTSLRCMLPASHQRLEADGAERGPPHPHANLEEPREQLALHHRPDEEQGHDAQRVKEAVRGEPRGDAADTGVLSREERARRDDR